MVSNLQKLQFTILILFTPPFCIHIALRYPDTSVLKYFSCDFQQLEANSTAVCGIPDRSFPKYSALAALHHHCFLVFVRLLLLLRPLLHSRYCCSALQLNNYSMIFDVPYHQLLQHTLHDHKQNIITLTFCCLQLANTQQDMFVQKKGNQSALTIDAQYNKGCQENKNEMQRNIITFIEESHFPL